MKALDRLLQRWRIAKAGPFIPSGARVLDVGCSDGALFRRLSSLIGSGVGIDPELRKPLIVGNARLYPGRFPDDMPEAEPFDVITMLAVLEHVPRAERSVVASACARLLKSGGRVIITVPSPLVDALLRVLRALRLVEGMSLEQHYGFEPREVVPLFTGAGLRLVVHRTFQLGLNNLFVFQNPEH
ncbi:MAG: methyltransferase domain-containing protein [Verrucomicrobia bacterium]|nr:methyltransferase domain-containing protein [Verrucomicrobiota bacterium]